MLQPLEQRLVSTNRETVPRCHACTILTVGDDIGVNRRLPHLIKRVRTTCSLDYDTTSKPLFKFSPIKRAQIFILLQYYKAMAHARD